MRATCIYLRNAPLGRAGGSLVPRRSCCVRNVALTKGWITGEQPLPARWGSERIVNRQSRFTHPSISRNFQTLVPSRSWKLSSPKPPTSDPDAETALPEQLRSVLRLLTNPIVVCTATHDGVPRAMTMSSFTSLTLLPTPLVSFNIATPSRTLDAIVSSQEFNIHVLAGDASGAAVADHFTRGNMDGVFDTIERATYSIGEQGSAPLIRGQGVLRVLRCKLLRDGKTEGLMRVRDHVIVVGEVLEMIPGAKVQEFGLAYADRRYRQVGSTIESE